MLNTLRRSILTEKLYCKNKQHFLETTMSVKETTFVVMLAGILIIPINTAPLGDATGVAGSDQDILSASETGYWALPFWYRRPVNDEEGDDDFFAGGNGGQYFPWKKNDVRSSTFSYVAVGAGWGR